MYVRGYLQGSENDRVVTIGVKPGPGFRTPYIVVIIFKERSDCSF